MDNTNARIFFCESIGNSSGGIGRCIVNDDELIIGDLARGDHALTRTTAVGNRPLDVLLFIPHWVKDRQHRRGRSCC